jgi:hypothetical protein
VLGRRSALALALLLLCISCEEKSEAEPASSAQEHVSAVDLGDVVLEASEAPPGTEYLAERSGTIRVEELWPSDCCPTQQMVFRDAGFSTAYARVFEKPGHTGEPIDTRAGWETVSSAAVLFRTEEGASTAMDSWLEYYESPALEAAPADGLGDEAVAVTGSPEAPAEVFFLYLWRVDRAVLNLRVSAGTGTVSVSDVRALVDAMDARVA